MKKPPQLADSVVLTRCDRCGKTSLDQDLTFLGVTGNGSRTVGLCPTCAHAVFVASRRSFHHAQ